MFRLLINTGSVVAWQSAAQPRHFDPSDDRLWREFFNNVVPTTKKRQPRLSSMIALPRASIAISGSPPAIAMSNFLESSSWFNPCPVIPWAATFAALLTSYRARNSTIFAHQCDSLPTLGAAFSTTSQTLCRSSSPGRNLRSQ